MKTAIRYFTKSKKGNTKKLADAVSAALGIEALDVSRDLDEKVDRLFLINAMYAANIDKEVKVFLERNKDSIGEVVNMNTAASGASTWNAVKKVTDELGVKLCDIAPRRGSLSTKVFRQRKISDAPESSRRRLCKVKTE